MYYDIYSTLKTQSIALCA